MKSSINNSPDEGDPLSVQKWEPIEFDTGSDTRDIAEETQRLADIFAPLGLEGHALDETIIDTQAAGSRSVSNWTPGEFLASGPGGTISASRVVQGQGGVSVAEWLPLEFDELQSPPGTDLDNSRFDEWGVETRKNNGDKFADGDQGEEDYQQVPEPDLELIATETILEAQLQAEELFGRAEKIVEEKLLAAQTKADELLQRARGEFDGLQETIQKEKLKAIEEAYLEGIAAGYAEMESSVQAAKSILEQFSFWRSEMISQSEDSLLDLVKEIASIMFSDGVVLDQEVLQGVVGRVLSNARSLGNLRIYVNPEDAKILDVSWREYQVLISGQAVKIFPTGAIRRGGCYVEGDQGTVDARVETQLTALLESLSSGAATSVDQYGEIQLPAPGIEPDQDMVMGNTGGMIENGLSDDQVSTRNSSDKDIE